MIFCRPDGARNIITPNDLKQNEEQLIHSTVQQVYVINRDDFNTREILLAGTVQTRRIFLTCCEKIIPSAGNFKIPKSSCRMSTVHLPQTGRHRIPGMPKQIIQSLNGRQETGFSSGCL
jgi:hypothetical protein